MPNWVMVRVGDLLAIALEYAGDAPLRGSSQDYRCKSGLEEEVARVAAEQLLEREFGGRLDPAIASGMAMNLSIELYGELHCRADGDVRGSSREAFEVFVPGGNPDGGSLPAMSAESRWRDKAGADFFIEMLQRARQDQGDLLGQFMLVNDDGGRRFGVVAPFLGPAAPAGVLRRLPRVLPRLQERLRALAARARQRQAQVAHRVRDAAAPHGGRSRHRLRRGGRRAVRLALE
jgi:hypothetical protein